FTPQRIGLENYVDAGLRETVPVDILVRRGATEIMAVVCSANELDPVDELSRVGILAVALHSLLEITLKEIVADDLEPRGSTAKMTAIMPTFNAIDTVAMEASLLDI